MNKNLLSLIVLTSLLFTLVPATSLAAPSPQLEGKTYTVQKDDWLSKIADKEYGDVMAYTAIVHYTNLKAKEDSQFARIDNPDRIEVGWLLYIPTSEEAAVYLGGQMAMTVEAPKPDSLTIAGVAGNESKGIKAIIPLWEQETGIKVEFVEFPYNTLFEKIVVTMQAGQDTFDLIMADDIWMPKFESEGWLVPLDETFGYQRDPDIFEVMYFASTWPPTSGPIVPGEESKPSHLYGVSILGNLQFFAYRPDLVSKPETWDDVIANAEKVQNPPSMSGFALRAAAGEAAGMEFFPLMYSYGGRLFDDNWNVTLDSPENLEALRMHLKLAQFSPPGVANFDAAERSREMASGRAAQIITWPAEAADFMENPEVSQVMGKVAYIAPPKGPKGSFPFLGNWTLGIPQSSNKKEWAYEFLKWATSAKVQKEYALAGGIPIRKSVFTDPELRQKFPYFEAAAQAYEVPPIVLPRTPEYIPIITIWGIHVNAAVAGLETPEEALSKAAAEIKTHLQEAGYYK
jgi:multiple sugar transport system substrate-binding protein